MALGKRLEQAMKRRGIDQVALAKLVPGASQPAISALIKRDSQTTTLLFGFADALKVNARWLLEGVGDSGLDDGDAPLPEKLDTAMRAELTDYWKELPPITKRHLLTEAKRVIAARLDMADRVNAELRKRLGMTGSATDRRVEEMIGFPPAKDRRKQGHK